ncbi:MAG: phosphonate transport system ATP-binding protein [Myxococcota bacterium]
MARFELKGAGRRFGTRVALADVDLVIEPGQKVALVGPSGSGKSTLLRLLSGALRASDGVVLVDGQDLSSLSARALRKHRGHCGIVEQGGSLVAQSTVHQNVLGGRLAHWPLWRTLAAMAVPLEKARTRSLLHRVGLADRQWDVAATLSGGQQQRVGIARALAGSPQTILADEPTASLDPTTSRDMVELLLSVAAENQSALVFCTHWVSLVTEHADRLVGLRDGQIVLDKPAAEVVPSDLEDLYAGSRELR